MIKFLKNNRILTLFIVFIAMINILFLFFIRPVVVSGESMYPTYSDGKYGFSIKFKPALDSIKRFDVVIVNSEITNNNNWVKRVIGLPGDTIEYKNDKLFVNGEVIEETFLNKEYMEKIKEEYNGLFTEDFGPVTLGEDEYFLMGDNRRFSTDSRYVGIFNMSDITSKHVFGLVIL